MDTNTEIFFPIHLCMESIEQLWVCHIMDSELSKSHTPIANPLIEWMYIRIYYWLIIYCIYLHMVQYPMDTVFIWMFNGFDTFS